MANFEHVEVHPTDGEEPPHGGGKKEEIVAPSASPVGWKTKRNIKRFLVHSPNCVSLCLGAGRRNTSINIEEGVFGRGPANQITNVSETSESKSVANGFGLTPEFPF